MLAIAALTLTSCSDDDTPGENNGSSLDPSDFKGTITSGQSETLDASVEYNLTGALVVQEGGTLTIPEGTVIKASGGTGAYIAVAQGGKIFVKGEADNPVIMTSAAASPQPGDWGGLVVCGRANTNKGGSNGETATSEVADLTYGGTQDNDNSGSIRYLVLEYTGAQFTNEKQFNGLSLFGVGSGTTVEYVQSYMGNDDGIEFFGGSVSGNYLISIGSGDDSIDFADGWSGSGSNWYIKGGAYAGIEGSNNGDDGYATPTTTATLSNISIVGPTTEGGLYIKEGGGIWDITNLYITNSELGFKIKSAEDDAAANEHVANGDITVTNVTFDNVTTASDYSGDIWFTTSAGATGAGNGADFPSWGAGWAKE